MVSRPVMLAAAMLMAAALPGCSRLRTPEIQIQPTASASRLQSATLVYRLDDRWRRSATAGSAAVRQVAPQPEGGRDQGRLATLSVKYPHPDRGAAYALVEVLVVQADPGGEKEKSAARGWLHRLGRITRDNLPGVALGEGIEEAKQLDVTKAELDHLLQRLNEHGYFGPARGRSPAVTLTTTVNAMRFDKPWTNVAELDQLMERARSKGRVVTFRQSSAEVAAMLGPAPHEAPHEALYAQLDARRQATHSTAPLPWESAPTPSRYDPPNARISRLPPVAHNGQGY